MKRFTDIKSQDSTTPCEICKKGIGIYWHNCQSETQWLRLNYSGTVMHCDDCVDKVKSLEKERFETNKQIAEENELDAIKNPTSEILKHIRIRFFNDLDCDPSFYEWIKYNVGAEKAEYYLNVKCCVCGNQLGHKRYRFEDHLGAQHIWTMPEIEKHIANTFNILATNDNVKIEFSFDGDYRYKFYYGKELLGKMKHFDCAYIGEDNCTCSQKCFNQ